MNTAQLFEANRDYLAGRTRRLLARFHDDDRGSATAEQIVMIGAAVIGAAAIGVIVWQKMTDGANSIQTPAP